MGQRNMLCPSQMIDLEMNQQGEGYFCPPPSIHFGGATNIHQPNIHTMITASGTSFDAQHLPERYDNAAFYGMAQYSGVQHHHNLDLGITTPSNYYYSYMTPSSSSGVLPVPLNHGASDPLPSSSHYGVIGVSADEYGRNSRIMDDVRGPCKRKNPEGLPGNFQYFNASATSSSSVPPLNIRNPDGVAVMDAVTFALPQYVGTGNLPIMEAGPQSSMRNRSATTGLDSAMTHDHNHLNQGNYVGQRLQPAGTLWLDQHLTINNGDGGASAWNQAPNIPFMHGGNVTVGSMDSANMGMQRYHDSSGNRSSTILRHPPPLNHRHHSQQVVAPPMQGLRGHNLNFPLQGATTASYRLPTSSSRSTVNPSQNGLEIGRRQPGLVPPNGFRIYRPHQGVTPETALRHQNLPHLRVLQADEGVIVDVPNFYSSFLDQHRDMRLDIEDMSYEELLALGEQIGHVSTGLSEERIKKQLKTRTYLSSSTNFNLEEAGCSDKEADSCIICQDNYKKREKIGTLHCGHEYHVDCLKKWLLVKNVCPICKSEALTTTGKKNV
ncbi:PREDICTED: probable E3 ubiquitin-protein ligase HIP1 isoform X1 [Prunus mume]|uniref:RING-type E3 ubiquitin transferase n=1 Tax=Prunus mume TaxID=102107 RepID=A0ABM0NL77_PRUMU|nr:PREDICTED: probable E3 ubiquitin-protein ligase HIP1 isoform X1 [Prunus mume]